MTPAGKIDVLVVKSFGDFTIALTMAERAVAIGRDVMLIAGGHLAALGAALTPAALVKFIDDANAVPALFDARRSRPVAVVRSALALHRAIEAHRRPGALLLLDKGGTRERLIAGRGGVDVLPPAPNIYAAYAAFFGSGDLMPAARVRRGAGRPTIGVFPSSRLKQKNVPATVIATVGAVLEDTGARPELVVLDKERPDLEAVATVLPRCFEALTATIGRLDGVISADSLPAHIAERMGVPVFVVMPRPNPYWLPASAFARDLRAMFTDADLTDRVGAFARAVAA